jgi:hypothetical protein
MFAGHLLLTDSHVAEVSERLMESAQVIVGPCAINWNARCCKAVKTLQLFPDKVHIIH